MSKNKNGIMGSNSGKIGTVVAYKWKGKDVFRAYSRSKNNPRTPAQQLHRAKFKSVNLLASDLLPLLKCGFRSAAERLSSTETGLFVKTNWPLVEADAEGGIGIPLDRVLVSKGDLPCVEFGEPQVSGSGRRMVVSVDFDTVDRTSVTNDDYVYLGAYCPAAKVSLLSAPVKRLEGRVQMNIPPIMLGETIHLYGFAEGSDYNPQHRYEASDSRYLGTIAG